MYFLKAQKIINQTIRKLSNTSGLFAKNHYNSLGITSKATQADVKGAYYKLSMIYHPDKNEGSSDAAQKFRDISEAYEVLGNIRLRRLYDKGVSHIGTNTSNINEDPSLKFYRSREHRTRPPTSGRQPIYDFDEWSRAHYGATFANDMEKKRKYQFHKSAVENEMNTVRTAKLLIVLGMMLAVLSYLSYNKNHDVIVELKERRVSER